MRFFLHAFPASFRRRYGDELLDLVHAGQSPVRDGTNLLLAGVRMRMATSTFGLGLVSAAALGSAVFGGCLVLGSAAAGGAAMLLADRWRLPLAQ